jgi:hypothetical protein
MWITLSTTLSTAVDNLWITAVPGTAPQPAMLLRQYENSLNFLRLKKNTPNCGGAGYPQGVDKLRYEENTLNFCNDFVTTRRVDLTDKSDARYEW